MKPVPSWVIDGWYANNPGLQALAIVRFHLPVTTAAERAAAKAFVPGTSYPCASCGRHAFPRSGTICYSCRKRRDEVAS